MKYMGSKRMMLQNGLGQLLIEEAKGKQRVVDLFCGAASVAWFTAQRLPIPVHAVDLQKYAVLLARSVLNRTRSLSKTRVWNSWVRRATEHRLTVAAWDDALALDIRPTNTATWSKQAIALRDGNNLEFSPLWNAYGAYYYSPTQALTLDALLATLPKHEPQRTTCHAAIIIAASRCAASPGHTAQPFKPTRSAAPFLREAWRRDPLHYTEQALESLCVQCAAVPGVAKVADAVEEASKLTCDDLVFVDPPYSDVHYSRFYHVLETVARHGCGPVDGVGRYPPPAERPASSFSRKTESLLVLQRLIERLASAGCTVIFTFPKTSCSNGLSGAVVEDVSERLFRVEKKIVKTKFSTLGGNNSHRKARKPSKELILLMRPKSTAK